jgi:tRNA (guanine-N7-)-methyltransferase
VGKNKLARWNELDTFMNVIQTETGKGQIHDHPVKGRWNPQLFRNDNPVVLELGCGRGEYTTGLAEKFPDKNFIGVDIKGARLWRGAKTSNENKLSNAAFLRTRIEFLRSYFAEDEIDEIWITFPDPHPGLRHSTKRLTSPRFLNLYRSFVRDNGIVQLKTDNHELHAYTLGVVKHNNLPVNSATSDLYSQAHNIGDVPEDILSIRTHYEKMFLDRGMKITYLSFRLEKDRFIKDPFLRKEP